MAKPSEPSRTMPLGADFARSVAECCVGGGATPVLDDAAAAALATQLELHLRTTLNLATRFARRARRSKLKCSDIADAVACGRGSEPYSGTGRAAAAPAHLRAQMLVAAARGQPSAVEPLDLLMARRLHAGDFALEAPTELRLHVRWLAIEGQPVAAPETRPGDALRGSIGVHHPAAHEGGRGLGGILVAPPALLGKEQLTLLQRIVATLEGGQEASKRRALVPMLCHREDLAALRPFLAHFLAQHVPGRLRSASPQELTALLGVLEAIMLSPQGAELYLHQCMPPAFLICLSPALGELHGSQARSSAGRYAAVRRRAASLIGATATRYRETIPEMFAEVCRVFEEALRRTPQLKVVAGAVHGLVALGLRTVEMVLVPVLREGLVEHIAASLSEGDGFVGCASAAAPSAEASEAKLAKAPAKRGMATVTAPPALEQTQAKRSRGFGAESARRFEADRAEAFEALFGAAMALSKATRSAHTATARLCGAAQLCEAVADAFGMEPGPLVSELARSQGLPPAEQLLAVHRPPRSAAQLLAMATS